MDNSIIDVNDVSIMFRLYRENVDSLKEFVVKKIKRQIAYDEFWALQNINFHVGRGEAVGLVGRNGSGKSTLLKTIAGVLKPTKGSVAIKGTVAPMIELGAGFDMDLTATENVFLNGAATQEIIHFACNIPLGIMLYKITSRNISIKFASGFNLTRSATHPGSISTG